jgi:hypothetical protein
MRLAVVAAHAARLRARMCGEGSPTIYANDNFGRWESDFAAVVAECERRGGASATMAKLLAYVARVLKARIEPAEEK